MRAMKDSGIEWIGEIPQGWNTVRTKYIAQITNGSDPKTEGDIPVYGSGDGSFKTCGEYKEGPAVLLGRKGATLHIPHFVSGRYWNVDTAFDVKTETECFDLKYYYALATCFDYRFYTSTTTLPGMTQTDYGNMYLPLPSIKEQKRIVKYLDDKCAEIDALITAKEKTNARLKERRQSIIFEAVTKGLNPTVSMKDSGVEWIGEIPEGWMVAPLKFFASIRSGFTLGKKYDSAQELCEYPYLRVANVQGEYTDLENVTTIQMPATEAEQYKLKVGELLMTEGGDRDKLGRGSIWHGEIPDCLHQNHVFALSADERLSIEYLDYLTASDVGRNYFDYTAVKTTNLASTNATTILNFKIPIPSIEEQRDIVAYLKQKCLDIDKIVQKNNDTIQKLKEYRQSLIYEAVTGKIEI